MVVLIVIMVICAIIGSIAWYKAENDGAKYKHLFWIVVTASLFTTCVNNIMNVYFERKIGAFVEETVVIPKEEKQIDTVIFIK